MKKLSTEEEFMFMGISGKIMIISQDTIDQWTEEMQGKREEKEEEGDNNF